MVSDAREGELVLLRGRAGGRPTLVAPFSRRPCLGYAIDVDGLGKDAEQRTWRERLCSDENEQELTLHDQTGVAQLGRKWRRITLARERISESPQPAEFRKWLASRVTAYHLERIAARDGWFEVREGILSLGDSVQVIGPAHWLEPSQHALLFRTAEQSPLRTLEIVGNNEIPSLLEVLDSNSK